jgi:hypothetical protein
MRVISLHQDLVDSGVIWEGSYLREAERLIELVPMTPLTAARHARSAESVTTQERARTRLIAFLTIESVSLYLSQKCADIAGLEPLCNNIRREKWPD